MLRKKRKKINKKYEKNSEEFQYGDFIKSDENSWIFVLYNRKTTSLEKYARAYKLGLLD